MMDCESNQMIYSNKYKVVVIVTTLFLSLSLLTTAWTYPTDFNSYARCPDDSHKNPSGDCESVVKSSTKLPRCPNGFHRSPSGICESVTGSTLGDSSSSSSSSNGGGSMSNQDNIIKDTNSNNSINNGQQQESDHQNNFPSSSNTITDSTTAIKPIKIALSTNTSAGKCDQSLWNHVYLKIRLSILDLCTSISGTIINKTSELDGDFHLMVKPDNQFTSMLTPANFVYQNGFLVVEPICQNNSINLFAILSCKGFHQNINIPPNYTHVIITGSYVLDIGHEGWAEIHPVTSIIKIP